jgi:lysophospholipase L1-like esterase
MFHYLKKIWVLLLLLSLPDWRGMAHDASMVAPYGIQSQISVGPELQIADRQLQLMTDAGITCIRTAMFRVMAEKPDGSWDYRIFDKMTRAAKKNNKQIIGVLLGFPDARRKNPMKHIDSWLNFVRKVVLRYQTTIQVYEIWNEQNVHHFWGQTPDPKNYAELLKRAYLEIKKINPSLTVSYGGTSGIPFDYLEASLKAGAGKWFDVMSVHPYEWGVAPEVIIPQIGKLRSLLKKYGLAHKPIWITETGWSTAQQATYTKKIMTPVLERLSINPAETTLGIVRDAYQYGDERSCDLFPKFKQTKFVTLEEVNRLAVSQVPILVATTGQKFPEDYIPAIISYVKRGGTIFLGRGLPFYYEIPRNHGPSRQVNDKWMKTFHIGWETWWTKKGVPRFSDYQSPAPEFEVLLSMEKEIPKTRFFLNSDNLKPGDAFIPVIEGGKGDYKAPICAIYQLNSDLKGAVILYPDNSLNAYVSEESQAKFIPRLYLGTMAAGVDRIVWHKFRSTGPISSKREAHWGIVEEDLTPKPAFQAYKNLTHMCPAGSTRPVMEVMGHTYLLHWKTPENKTTWAIWNASSDLDVTMTINGTITEATDHLGNKRDRPQNGKPYRISPSVTFLTGAIGISIKGLAPLREESAHTSHPHKVDIKKIVNFSPRKGMPNFFHKLAVQQKATIAFLGGSITQAKGWRTQTTDYLRRNFPGSTIKTINAGLNGTGSTLGALRLNYDVLRHKPDLIFVEFAVNDSRTQVYQLRKAMEGIVRHTWKSIPESDLCFVYTFSQNDLKQLNKGNFTRSISVFEDVADYYGIPSVFMGADALSLLQQGIITIKTNIKGLNLKPGKPWGINGMIPVTADGKLPFSRDGVHPYINTGHILYANVLKRALSELSKLESPRTPHTPLSSPILENNYEDSTMFTLSAPEFQHSGSTAKLSENSMQQRTFGKRTPEVWKLEPGSEIKFKFRGTKALIYALLGLDAGILEIKIDGNKRTIKQSCFDAYGDFYRVGDRWLIETEKAEEHTVQLKVKNQIVDKRNILRKNKQGFFDKNPAKFIGNNIYIGGIFIVGELIDYPHEP